jgi:hypothetical protein
MLVVDRSEQGPILRLEWVLNSRNAPLGLQHERPHPFVQQQSSGSVLGDRVEQSLFLERLAHSWHCFAVATHKNLNPRTAG